MTYWSYWRKRQGFLEAYEACLIAKGSKQPLHRHFSSDLPICVDCQCQQMFSVEYKKEFEKDQS